LSYGGVKISGYEATGAIAICEPPKSYQKNQSASVRERPNSDSPRSTEVRLSN